MVFTCKKTMLEFKSVLFFIFLVALCITNGWCKNTPVWAKSYSVSGTLYLPYSELLEPFSAWYDGENELSRIDYYQGMVKTYQLGSQGTFGSSFQVVPVTTESFTNKLTCFSSYGSDDAPVSPQTILPDVSNFKFVGEEVMNGYQCEIWREINVNFTRISTYTLWIRWQKNPSSPALSEAIPVRYEMKGFNTLLGSHYDHYYLNYEDFHSQNLSPSVFDVSKNLTCNGLNDELEQHNYNFNPMKEFIDKVTDHADNAWHKYKLVHDKSYDNHVEHSVRRDTFKHNLRYIHSTNRKGLTYKLKVNHLADRSESELRLLKGGIYKSNNGYSGADKFPFTQEQIVKLSDSLPQSLDWRIQGAVTPVKDQATCGSCWGFSSVGAMEGAYFLKSGQLIRFSEQALVDCTWGFGNNGCSGGSHQSSFQWISKHGGIPSDEDYGYYLGQDGYCHTNLTKLMAPITGFVSVPAGNESALKLSLFKNGPISVFIDASHKSFSFYSSGVYYEPECKSDADSLDHVVLLIGYGTLDKQDYWLIKNSWSNHWGDQGYVLMSTKNNNCGVMTIPMYVTM